MTFEEADNWRTNPYYNTYYEDTKSYPYNENCQKSCIVFELRLRGFNCKAAKYDVAENNFYRNIFMDSEEKSLSKDNIFENLSKIVNKNERFFLRVINQKNNAHLVNIFRDKNGKFVLFDSRTGNYYVNKQIKNYLIDNMIDPYPAYLMRVDNKKVIAKYLKGVYEK